MKVEYRIITCILYGLSILIISPQVSAATYQVAKNRTITQIRTYEDYAIVTVDPPIGDASGDAAYNLSCDASATVELNNFAIDWSVNAAKKTLYNAALAAKVLNATVGVGIKDTGGCYPFAGGVPVIYRIDQP